jgi:hypothetical protein
MNKCANNSEWDEMRWIKSYVNLTGVTESQARSVYMYVGCKETWTTEEANGWPLDPSESDTLVLAPASDVA